MAREARVAPDMTPPAEIDRWYKEDPYEALDGRRDDRRSEPDPRREVRADIAELRSDLHALTERVARIEGTLSGRWRPPANGTPAPSPPPEDTA